MQRQSTNLKRKKEKERYGTTQAAHYITPPRTMAAFFLHSSTSPEWSRRPPSKKKKRDVGEGVRGSSYSAETHACTNAYLLVRAFVQWNDRGLDQRKKNAKPKREKRRCFRTTTPHSLLFASSLEWRDKRDSIQYKSSTSLHSVPLPTQLSSGLQPWQKRNSLPACRYEKSPSLPIRSAFC